MSTRPFQLSECSTANVADGSFSTFCTFPILHAIWLLVNVLDTSVDGRKFEAKGRAPTCLRLPETVLVLK